MAVSSTLKKIIVIVPVITAVAAVGYFKFIKTTDIANTTFAKAELADIEQIVSVDGVVESDSKIDLRFSIGGKVDLVNALDGVDVKRDEVLMSLENESAEIELSRTQAVLNIARANLNLKYAGPSAEDLRLSEIAIEEVETNLDNAVKKILDIKLAGEEALKSAELSIVNSEMTLGNMQSAYDNYEASGETSNIFAKNDLEEVYENAGNAISESLDILRISISKVDIILDDYNDSIFSYYKKTYKYLVMNGLKYTKENLESNEENYKEIKELWEKEDVEVLVVDVIESLEKAKTLLDDTYNALDNSRTTQEFTQEKLDLLKIDISQQQTLLIAKLNTIQSVNQRIIDAKLGITSTVLSVDTSLINAKTSLDNAINGLELAKSTSEQIKLQNILNESDAEMNIDVLKVKLMQAEANHDKLVAKPRNVDIASLSAQVDQAKAIYAKALKNLEDNQILAPFDGVVTDVKVNLGETININEVALVMMVDRLNIVANIPESDISKVNIGDKVDIELDAFGESNIFNGIIMSVNPAETVVQGVIYYEAKIIIDEPLSTDEKELYKKIRSGMTADVKIVFDSKENVIVVPESAINRDASDIFVYIQNNLDEKEKRVVVIGLEGNGKVEILTGLDIGDNVIINNINE